MVPFLLFMCFAHSGIPYRRTLLLGHISDASHGAAAAAGWRESALLPKIWRRDDRGSPSSSERYDLQKKEVLLLRPRCEMCDRFFRLFVVVAFSPDLSGRSSPAPGERGRRKEKVVSLALW